MRHHRAASIIGLLALTACASGGDSESTAPSASTTATASVTTLSSTTPPSTTLPTTTLPVVGSPGCAESTATSATTISLVSGGRDRSSLLSLPTGADIDTPAPLIVDLHGLGADAAAEAAYSGLAARGSTAGFIVATPESAAGDVWFLPGVPGVDDVQFISDLIDTIGATRCIDPARVFVVGISNGGGLAAGIGCELSEKVAAIAPVAGVNIIKPCDSQMSVIAFHGTADPLIPYEGGAPFSGVARTDPQRSSEAGRGLSKLQLGSVEDAVATWATNDGCTAFTDTQIGSDVTHRKWTGCADDTRVELYSVHGGGHTWPGATPLPPLGPTTATIDATQLMLDAFVSF